MTAQIGQPVQYTGTAGSSSTVAMRPAIIVRVLGNDAVDLLVGSTYALEQGPGKTNVSWTFKGDVPHDPGHGHNTWDYIPAA